jgi:hypothetical protein
VAIALPSRASPLATASAGGRAMTIPARMTTEIQCIMPISFPTPTKRSNHTPLPNGASSNVMLSEDGDRPCVPGRPCWSQAVFGRWGQGPSCPSVFIRDWFLSTNLVPECHYR